MGFQRLARLDNTTFRDAQRQYLDASITCLSTGAGRIMTTADWRQEIDEIAAEHRERFTVDAWISAGTQELWLEYLDRIHRDVMIYIDERLRFVFVDRDQLMQYAKQALEAVL